MHFKYSRCIVKQAFQDCPAAFGSWHTCCQVFHMPSTFSS